MNANIRLQDAEELRNTKFEYYSPPPLLNAKFFIGVGSEVTKTPSLHKHKKDILEEALLCCFLSTVLQKEVIWRDQIWNFREHVFGLAVLFVFH